MLWLLFLLLLCSPVLAQELPPPEIIPLGAALDTEQPDLALQLLDEIMQKPLSPAMELELSLVGLEVSRQAGLPQRFQAFLKRARPEGATATLLVESYAFEDLRRRDPEQARRELLPRLDRALGVLEKYQPERERWSLLAGPQLGRALGIWMEALVAQADEQPREVPQRLERLLELGRRMALAWAKPPSGQIQDARLGPWLGLVEAQVAASRRLRPGDALARLLDPEREQAELVKVAHSYRDQARAALGPQADQLLDLMLGATYARLQLQQVRWVCEEAAGRAFTDAEAARVKPLLESAKAITQDRASLALANDLFLTTIEALFHARKPGWEAGAEKLLVQLPPSIQSSRPDRVRALTLRARLRMRTNQGALALADLQEAAGLLEDLIRETGGSPAAAQQIRDEARETYELLTRLQLQGGKTRDAFETVSRLQQLEAASLFPVRGLSDQAERLASLERQGKGIESVQQEVRGAHSTLQRLAPGTARVSKLQAGLPSDAVLVQLLPAESELYVFGLTRDRMVEHTVKIPRAELEALIEQVRRQCQRPDAGDPAPGLQRLYQLALQPVEPLLQGKKLVILAPSHALLYAPWAALRRSDGSYVVASQAIVVSPRTLAVEEWMARAADKPGKLGALGNPDGSLPAAGQEVQALEPLFPGSEVFLEKAADRQALVRASGAGMVHLATHGVANSREPTASYLVLAAGDKLRYSDVPDLKLKSTLVTLSACQTALGERRPGDQLRSLAEAFSLAGGQSVLASLWKIDDQATRDLMVHFYKELAAGKSRAEALRSAQAAMTGRHPFYWAAFVLFGDPR